jgi:NADH dehydrogenase
MRAVQPGSDGVSRSGRPHVVVVGAGFGGLSAARALRRAPVKVTIVDRENHHLFQPLLYQVAMAGLSVQDIAAPTRAILSKQRNATVLLAEVMQIDLGARQVVLDAGVLAYDFLIVASGAETSYFGHDDWRARTSALKNADDALEIRRRVLLAFELAEREGEVFRRRALLRFVVIGAGPTGVELAGAMSELARVVLAKDFRSIEPASAQVYLVEIAPRVLPTFEDALSAKALAQLRELGVDVLTGSGVRAVDEDGIELASGQRIHASTVIWTAGVRPSPLATRLGVALDPAGRVVVDQDLSIPGHPEAFAIGDIASFVEDGRPLPGVSPVAMQEGRAAARAIIGDLRSAPRGPFRYHDKGMMVSVGRSRAIAQLRHLRFGGRLAWWLWLVVHIWYLVGFRNRLVVVINWAWAYLTYKQGARVITGQHAPPLPAKPVLPEHGIAERTPPPGHALPVHGRSSA